MRVPPERRPVGVVFQDDLLFPHLSALDNIAFGLRMRGASRAEARRRATRRGLRTHARAPGPDDVAPMAKRSCITCSISSTRWASVCSASARRRAILPIARASSGRARK